MKATKKQDGGPAFPVATGGITGGRDAAGVSLRDYFAAAALTGLLSGLPAAALGRGEEIPRGSQTYAAAAYRLADVMLEEREKR